MPSPEVCAYIGFDKSPRLLVIDAFNRLAGPQPLRNDTIEGFDLNSDFGVPMARMPGYCGRQLCWDKAGYGREGYGGLGHSTAELEGIIIAGNTRDWTTRHARDFIVATDCQTGGKGTHARSFFSPSRPASIVPRTAKASARCAARISITRRAPAIRGRRNPNRMPPPRRRRGISLTP